MARVQIPVTTLGPVQATLTTALTGTNNDLVFTARDAGPGGNDVTITYLVAGNNTPLSVAAYGKAIVVNVATDGGGAATSTASQVAAAIAASIDANALATVTDAPSNDGTGVVTALSSTPLAGGALGVTQPAQTNSDATNDMYLTGNDGLVLLEVYNANASPQTVEIELAPSLAPGVSVAGAPQVETIAAGATKLIAELPPSRFNQNQARDVYINPSVTTDLKFRAYQLSR